ncbi:hypothetical protein ACS15_5029 [Ralstonia insidiosa]|uniref:Uncharacterized protein n=1 Tax=Ralstonia insidiosa TaxID=190721 RepID=A0AAC9BNC5_9RALS|nr:hypothetical protein ACS15_5029 [Ralstonia insidiosa]EPX98918.1 hypothetical protein C404_05420 [Ralstonia sp. AU12-08]
MYEVMLAVALPSIGSGFVVQAVNAYGKTVATAIEPMAFQIFIGKRRSERRTPPRRLLKAPEPS